MDIKANMKKAVGKLVSLDEPAWARIESCLVPKRLLEGHHIIREGAVARYVGFVGDGCLRSFYYHDGEEYTVNFFLPGDFFGDCQNFIARDPSTITIQAVEPSQLLLIPLDDLNQMEEEFPAVESLGKRITEKHYEHERKRITSFLSDNAEKRYLDLLENKPLLIRRTPQHMVASYLGMSPETLSRVRRHIAQ